MEKYQRIIDACYRLRSVLKEDDENKWDAVRDEVIKATQEDLPSMYKDFDAAYAELLAITVAMEYHLRKGDILTIGGRFLEYIDRYDMLRSLSMTDEQRRLLNDTFAETAVKVRVYMRSVAYPVKPAKIRDASCRCRLCKHNLADFTGSHMVPNVLLQRFFTFDGKPKRDREAVEVYNISADSLEHYFGNNVGIGAEQFTNRPLTDEECEEECNKENVLKFDNYFCTSCEKKLGVLEDHYGEYLSGKCKAPDPALAYLFWLSVFWRASLVGMAIKMQSGHEEKLRQILNRCLALKKEDVITQPSKMGHCVYQLLEAEDTKDETLGVFGLHNPHLIPYKLMIGSNIINLLMSKDTMKRFVRDGEPKESFNDGVQPEMTCRQPFLAFWLQKRSIFNENYCYEHATEYRGGSRIKDYAQMQNMEDWGDKTISSRAGFSLRQIDKKFVPLPRSIRKIIDYINAHPNSSLQEMSEALNYTQEEISQMWQYFLSTSNGLLKTRRLWTAER